MAQFSLIDGNSQADINPGGPAGMYNWFVDGTDYLAQQWFWYRIGGVPGGPTPEQPINTIGAPVNNQPNARQLTSTYNNGVISLRVDYTLNGGTPGSGNAQILESITINNLTAQPILGFNFFQYSDFDLGAVDTVQLGTDLSGKFNEALQISGPIKFVEAANTPGANRGEVNTFPTTLNKLNDLVSDNLNNNAGPVAGDVTWALQWTFDLAPFGQPNSSFVISKEKNLSIPEPSALALISLGLIGYAVKRSRSSA